MKTKNYSLLPGEMREVCRTPLAEVLKRMPGGLAKCCKELPTVVVWLFYESVAYKRTAEIKCDKCGHRSKSDHRSEWSLNSIDERAEMMTTILVQAQKRWNRARRADERRNKV